MPPALPGSMPPAQPGPERPRNLPTFAEFTSPAPSSGGAYSPPAPLGPGSEQYSELTTDIAGRDQVPFGQPEGDMRMGGLFPGPASRATVTPPGPDDTTSWPGNAQSKFDQFKPEADAAPAKPETPHVRMLPILLAVVIGAVLLLGIVFGIVYLVAGGNGDNKAITVKTGECVKRDGTTAIKADCSDTTAFQVVSIEDDKTKCADPQQPYVVNPTSDGKNQVLCLKPNS
jgi:hypothetical protein